MTLPEAAHFGGAKKTVKERPLVPPPAHRRPPDAQDDHLETSSTSTCCSLHYFQSCKEFINAARAHVGESCSMPSSAVGSVDNDKGAVYCFLFIPPSVAWAAGLSRWGYPLPLNPGRPPERAGESTRTPLISPEKLALLRPARGAPLASSLAGFFRETRGQWGVEPGVGPTRETAFCHILLFNASICATEGEQ